MRVRYDALALEHVLLACGSIRYGDGAGAAPLEVWGFYRAEGLLCQAGPEYGQLPKLQKAS